MSIRSYKLSNARIATDSSIIFGSLLIKDEKIDRIITGFDTNNICQSDEKITDISVNNHLLIPGFIDIHCHGGHGSSFMDCSIDDFNNILSFYLKSGTTTIFPTSMSCSNELLTDFLDNYDIYLKNNYLYGYMLRGVHLEGPYLSVKNAGAQEKKFCTTPDIEFVKRIIQKYPFIKRWTIAPEMDINYDLAHYLCENNVLVSAGHTSLLYDEMCEAFNNGYHHMTHLYSGMNSLVYVNGLRKAGAVESALLDNNVSVEIICDGIHLPYPFINIVYQMKGSDNIAIVSDAMRATGTNCKSSILGNRHSGIPVIIDHGVAKLPNCSSLAGSVTSLLEMFQKMIRNTRIPLLEIIKMFTYTPAKIMNIHNSIGMIAPGFIADLIELDDDYNLIAVVKNGEYIKANSL